MSPRLQRLPYHPDSAKLFAEVRHLPWAVFLDSGRPMSQQGRYDIIAADPWRRLTTHAAQTLIEGRDSAHHSAANPLELLREQLNASASSAIDGLPFCGGAIGYFGYDLVRRFESLPSLAEDAEGLPEMQIGLYDWALVVDHHAESSWLLGQGRDTRTERRWDELVALFSNPKPAEAGGFQLTGPLGSNLTRAEYQQRFERIQRYIHDGDCYQVNFAQRFEAPAEGDPWALYLRLRRTNPAPFGAYLQLPDSTLLSSSPERFLRLCGDRVESAPIKGTSPRFADPEADRRSRRQLQQSEKDRAENLMIVDLLRNDLGRVCRPGSIRVERLFEIESFARVHHLVSQIEGRLAAGRDALDLLQASLPGGSITGAPKLRAMQIIEELEPHRRGVYCGAIGYLGFDGAMDTNIAIRTMVWSDQRIRFWAGGGIVADSEVDAEYQETLYKVAPQIELLQELS
ncbi:aminodeoxychorismate synthase component I [endosymbiont of Ridgeia piscesae]|jgi:para-aminobenzoate synthetase component 1|uniref:aminodeoxychorismate synthase n=1 Tax=endosymbiont of Ridgeia piscesae TaxID=54398 RepID=A0A0T5YVP0_9GAMM|nr:aminodeoxychorismate synthase component I [endosymbiont of Ridgeia piscesae]KRT54708.1 aminodeoxychorismate synthase, component I, bacterial clade [endosymbiont of Ridgeia piscesae]KRT59449.1 para-aminobenzoate synthetase component 1 [endosymbiont of Ridgeia piscesae]